MTINIGKSTQACWNQELADYDIKIFYGLGSANVNPNALCRRLEYHPKARAGSAKENKNQPIHHILKPDQ
jgi:hypothetical protein